MAPIEGVERAGPGLQRKTAVCLNSLSSGAFHEVQDTIDGGPEARTLLNGGWTKPTSMVCRRDRVAR